MDTIGRSNYIIVVCKAQNFLEAGRTFQKLTSDHMKDDGMQMLKLVCDFMITLAEIFIIFVGGAVGYVFYSVRFFNSLSS
jgi:hypothetical protein